MELRTYQQQLINATRVVLRSHRNVLTQAPTGAGKTVLAAYMLERVCEKNKRGFFICHRRELVDQTAATFDAAGIEYGYIAAGYQSMPYAPIQIASIDTLKNRLHKIIPPDFCIFDEAHHLGAAGWARVHRYYDRAYHVGLSATPQRLDGKGLDDRFDCLVPGPQVAWLIEHGFLARYKLYSVPGADLTGVHTRMGDYVKSEAEAVMDTNQIMGDIIGHWRKYAIDKLTIAFAVSVKHSEHLAAQFRAQGIMAAHLDGKSPKDDRRAVLRAFAKGDIRVISNVGLFGEGFDAAANSGLPVTVGAVIDAAPTQSLGAWLQRCGRALRPQRTHAIILDHAGNALRHGMPCEPREWTLAGREKKTSGGDGVAVKQCPKCYAVSKPQASKCNECGHVFAVQARKVEEIDGELAEMDAETLRRQRAAEQGQAQTLEALIALGRQRGYKSPERWAAHVYTARRAKRGATRS